MDPETDPIPTTTDPPVITTQPPVITTTPDPPPTTTDPPPPITDPPPPITDPVITEPPVTTSSTITLNDTTTPPRTTTTTHHVDPPIPPTRTSTTATPYTTSWITTLTVTVTRVPRTTVISGRSTTVYIPVTTLVPTVIRDPNQAPPPSDVVPETTGMSSWQIVLVVLAVAMLILAVTAAFFVRNIRKKRRLEDERRKREALIEVGAMVDAAGGVVDIDALAMGRRGGSSGGGGWKGGGGGEPEMTTLSSGAAARQQQSMEQFRESIGQGSMDAQQQFYDGIGGGRGSGMHQPSMSNSSEGTGGIMMLEEYPGSSGYYYEYYGNPQQQDPSIFQQDPSMLQQDPSMLQQDLSMPQQDPSMLQQDPSMFQQDPSMFQRQPQLYHRQSYPLPPGSTIASGSDVVQEPCVLSGSDRYAEDYEHGYDAGAGTGAGAGAGSGVAAASGLSPFFSAQPPRTMRQLSLDGSIDTAVSELYRHPSTGNQTSISNDTSAESRVSLGAVRQGANTSSRRGGGRDGGGSGITRMSTPVTSTGRGATPSIGSRDRSTSDLLYHRVVNNPHTDYVAMQPSGVYAPSPPSSPQMLQIGRTHVQDSSGFIHGVDIGPHQVEPFTKEENRRKNPQAYT